MIENNKKLKRKLYSLLESKFSLGAKIKVRQNRICPGYINEGKKILIKGTVNLRELFISCFGVNDYLILLFIRYCSINSM